MISSRITIAIIFGWLSGMMSGILITIEYTTRMIPGIIINAFIWFIFIWALITGEKQ